MLKFDTLTSSVVPLPLKDIDTDMVIPAQHMTSVSREGYGEHLFARLRSRDPNFPLNLEKYRNSRILAADSNFGCGSSREHAVWALMDWGFRVIISKSFADIFYNNSLKNGLLPIVLKTEAVDRILQTAAEEELSVEVDLTAQLVKMPDGRTIGFEFDQFRKYCILNGLDDIDYIRGYQQEIDDYRARRAPYQFVDNQPVDNPLTGNGRS